MLRRTTLLVAVLALALPVALAGGSLASDTSRITITALDKPVRVVRDALGIPHVQARTERDAYFAVGYVHAQDRLFQMDQSRRQASGTLAELLGPSALGSDVQLRTLGLRRAAQHSLAALSPRSVAQLEAYAAGVNAWVASNALPPEYGALELTNFTPWTALDSVAATKLIAFGLSFDLGDIANTQRLLTYQGVGAALGFDGRKLFTEDVMRSEPFAHVPSIRPGETSGPVRKREQDDWSSSSIDDQTSSGQESCWRGPMRPASRLRRPARARTCGSSPAGGRSAAGR